MEYHNSIEFLESYCNFLRTRPKTQDTTLSDFALWILEDKKKSPSSISSSSLAVNETEEEISRLLVLMYRYAKGHLKTYLSDFPELIQEDFTYIYVLKRQGSMTKTQLIEANVHEKTSGLEIIRRLLKNGLIEESNDTNDKRSKRVTLTNKGEEMVVSVKSVTRKVAKLITGKLDFNEKEQLLSILKKLDLFHQPLYLSKNKLTLDFAMESYSLN
jgi:DNA-binding MarR family transcriptional regulator